MPYFTDYKQYPVPRDEEEYESDGIDGPIQGTISTNENWGDTMQTLVRQLERDIPSFGPLSERPPFESGIKLYFATDASEQQWYFNSGSQWVEEAEYEPDEDNTGGGSGGTGDIPADAAAVSNLSITNWRIIDVANHGYPGDMSGGDLTNLFENYTDTIFYLPDGEYEMTEFIADSYKYFGMIGQQNATIHPRNTSLLHFMELGGTGSNSNGGYTLLKNLEFTIEDEIAGNQAFDCGLMTAHIHDTMYMKNVSFRGTRHRKSDASGTTTYGSRYQTKLECAEDGVIDIDRLVMPDGGTFEGTTGADMVGHSIGVAVEEHEGVLNIKNSRIERFVDNGLYTTHNLGEPEKGIVNIKNTVIKNCGNSNFRPGINHTIENCRAVQDDTTRPSGWTGVNLNIQDLDNCVIDGMRIINEGNINDVVRVQGGCTGVDVRDVVIDNTESVNVLEINGDTTNERQPVSFTNCKINDTGTGNSKGAPILVDRPGVTFDRCEVNTADRHGFILDENGKNTTIQNTTINVPTSEYQVRLDENGRVGPGGTVRIIGCRFYGGRDAFYQDTQGSIDTLITKDNDFTQGAGSEDIRGNVTTWVHKANPGWIAPDLSGVVSGRYFGDQSAEPRTNRPANPGIGEMILRKDLTPRRVEVYDGNGWQIITSS